MARREQFHVNQLFASTINGFPFPGGVGMGRTFYVAPADSTTSYYRGWLVANGVDPGVIFSDLPAAEDACVANRNDTVFVLPGTYTQTAKITWDKSSTHLFGVGSPNQRIPATAGTYGNVYFPCATAMTELFLITGHHCCFENFSTYLSTATGVADVRVQGRNVLLKNLFMKGGQDATQLASAVLGYALYVDGSTAGYSNALTVEDCHIGDPRNTKRTAGGMIYMTGAAQGNNSAADEFRNCMIAGWSETAACSAVFQTGNFATGFYTLWDDCIFYNHYTNYGAILTQVFTDTSGTGHTNLLTGKTSQYGWGKWTGLGAATFIAMPTSSTTGGTMITAT